MTEMKDVIAARRKALGYTQEQLAEQIGVSAKVVSKWETGRSLPDTAFLPSLCTVLRIEPRELLFPAKEGAAGADAGPKESKSISRARAGDATGGAAAIVYCAALLLAAILALAGFFGSRADYYGEYAALCAAAYVSAALFCVGGATAFLLLRARSAEKCTLAEDKRLILRVAVFTYCLAVAALLAVVFALGADHGGAELLGFAGIAAGIFLALTLCFVLVLLWNRRRK